MLYRDCGISWQFQWLVIGRQLRLLVVKVLILLGGMVVVSFMIFMFKLFTWKVIVLVILKSYKRLTTIDKFTVYCLIRPSYNYHFHGLSEVMADEMEGVENLFG
jgi:hypothetical protein